jgi:octaprenyl-diphosphate synthase
MSQGIRGFPTRPNQLSRIYAPIRADLEEVERILRKELRSRHPFVDRLARHGFRLGGKRLRPALVLFSAMACGDVTPEHRLLAAVVEMIHTATLIHDDVLDEATLRRHSDTVNARWDNETSVLLGDYLFTRAICLVASLGDLFACRAISQAGKIMCEGELRQIENRGNYDLGEAQYLDIVAGKTGALCACCCRLGAHYAGADPEACGAFARFGLNLGIAFQIVDDVLDLSGDETTTGKSLGTDLVKEKPTLPLIRLLSQVDDGQRAQLLTTLSSTDGQCRDALKPWWEGSDALVYARRKAACFVRRAVEKLPPLPAMAPDGPLKQLAEFIVARQQ